MNTLSKLSLLFLIVAVAVLTAQPNPSTVTVTPYIVTGEGWGTSIVVHNFETEPAAFSVKYNLRDSIGVHQPFPSQGQGHTYGQVYSLGPHGSVTIKSTDGPWMLTGYAEIEAPKDLQFTAVYRRGDEHHSAAFVRPPQTIARTEFDSLSSQTALAIVNANQAEQHVLARFFSESGALLRSSNIGMAPASTISFDVGEWTLPDAKGNLIVTAPDGVSVLNLRFSPAGSFTSFPVQ